MKKKQKKYWRAIRKDGKVYRSYTYGYEIIVNGRKFYSPFEDCSEDLTCGETGYFLGSLFGLKNRFDVYLKRAAELPSVLSLPLKSEVDFGE